MKQSSESKLSNLWSKGTDFLGTKYSILGGAMTWVSDSNLVSAISNAGGFGVIACGSMDYSMFIKTIRETKEKTKKPFGVNVILMHPDLDNLVDCAIKEKVTHIVLAGGIPSKDIINKIKNSDSKSIGFAPSTTIAKKLVRSGIDALIVEGSEAGGHVGPTSTSVLAQEILPLIKDVPVFVAGGIARGDLIVTYLQMGASGCQLGTRFVCTNECIAHDNFKKAFIRAQARDAQTIIQIDSRFPVIPVRAINNNATKEFHEFQKLMIKKVDSGEADIKSAQLEIEHYWAGSLRKAVVDGDIDSGSIMAGQSVGMVNKIQSVQEVIDEIISQSHEFLDK